MQVLEIIGTYYSSIIFKENGILKSVSIDVKDCGENGWDPAYGREEILEIKVEEISDFKLTYFAFNITEEDLKNLSSLLKHNDGLWDYRASYKICGSIFTATCESYEGNSVYIDLDWELPKISYFNSFIMTSEAECLSSTNWYNNIDDFIDSIFSEDTDLFIDEKCSYKDELNYLLEMAENNKC
jgi:hypothetical protein